MDSMPFIMLSRFVHVSGLPRGLGCLLSQRQQCSFPPQSGTPHTPAPPSRAAPVVAIASGVGSCRWFGTKGALSHGARTVQCFWDGCPTCTPLNGPHRNQGLP